VITIYHLDTSRSERIVWLMEELGLEYKLELFQRNDNGSAPDALREIHALGKAPVIRDGDTVLAESGAIVDYIVHRYAGDRLAVAPAAAAYARYIYWFHFAEGSLMSLLILALVIGRVPEANASPVRTRVLERMKQTLFFIRQYSCVPAAHRVASGIPEGNGARRPERKIETPWVCEQGIRCYRFTVRPDADDSRTASSTC
jgi:glutathione S-transferase